MDVQNKEKNRSNSIQTNLVRPYNVRNNHVSNNYLMTSNFINKIKSNIDPKVLNTPKSIIENIQQLNNLRKNDCNQVENTSSYCNSDVIVIDSDDDDSPPDRSLNEEDHSLNTSTVNKNIEPLNDTISDLQQVPPRLLNEENQSLNSSTINKKIEPLSDKISDLQQVLTNEKTILDKNICMELKENNDESKNKDIVCDLGNSSINDKSNEKVIYYSTTRRSTSDFKKFFTKEEESDEGDAINTSLKSASKKKRKSRQSAAHKELTTSESETYITLEISKVAKPPKHFTQRERLTWVRANRNIAVWVQCSNRFCQKYRYLKEQDPANIVGEWNCSMNSDPEHNSCNSLQASYSPGKLIDARFIPGSIVMAKLGGYPWWPALVDDDPEFERFYWLLDYKNRASHYNVVFFDKEVSRAWIERENVLPFNSNLSKIQAVKKGKKDLDKGMATARIALKLSIKERLEKYSFIARYSGPLFNFRHDLDKFATIHNLPPYSDSETSDSENNLEIREIQHEDIGGKTDTSKEVAKESEVPAQNKEESRKSVDIEGKTNTSKDVDKESEVPAQNKKKGRKSGGTIIKNKRKLYDSYQEIDNEIEVPLKKKKKKSDLVEMETDLSKEMEKVTEVPLQKPNEEQHSQIALDSFKEMNKESEIPLQNRKGKKKKKQKTLDSFKEMPQESEVPLQKKKQKKKENSQKTLDLFKEMAQVSEIPLQKKKEEENSEKSDHIEKVSTDSPKEVDKESEVPAKNKEKGWKYSTKINGIKWNNLELAEGITPEEIMFSPIRSHSPTSSLDYTDSEDDIIE